MVIGIDTSGGVCSVAACSKGNLISEFSVNHKKTHSAMLVPMLDEMLKKADISLEEALLFAVASGPGSFTGLRIGAACAKGLALALNKPLVGVSTLDALSYNLVSSEEIVCPIMDARRNEVYTAAYDYKDEGMDAIIYPVIEPQAISIDLLVEKLNTIHRPVTFLGDGVFAYAEEIKNKAEFSISFAPTNLNLQRASSVAILGEYFYENGINRGDNPLQLSYLRRPQAERERLENEGSNI